MKNDRKIKKSSSLPEAPADLPLEPDVAPCRPVGWWIKAFVVFHVLAITFYALPEIPVEDLRNNKPNGSDWLLFYNTKYLKTFPVVQGYLYSTGFWQYWDMFAPNPVRWDQYGTADIIYQNGAVSHFQYPRMSTLSIPQKFMQERYRKFFERVHDYYNNPQAPKGFVAQRFAQRVALMNDKNPQNPPVEVKLYLYNWNIPVPGKMLEPKYTKTLFFDYIVDQQLMAKDKAGDP